MTFEVQNKFLSNAVSDVPDTRDWMYQPALVALNPPHDPPENLTIMDQDREAHPRL